MPKKDAFDIETAWTPSTDFIDFLESDGSGGFLNKRILIKDALEFDYTNYIQIGADYVWWSISENAWRVHSSAPSAETDGDLVAAPLVGQALTDGSMLIGDGSGLAEEVALNTEMETALRAANLLGTQQALELEKGVDVQEYDALLADLAGQTIADGSMLLGDGADSFEVFSLATGIEGLLKNAIADGDLTIDGQRLKFSGDNWTTDFAFRPVDNASNNEKMILGFNNGATSGGGGFEIFGANHATRPGEFAVLYGGSTTSGSTKFTHYNGTDYEPQLLIYRRVGTRIGDDNIPAQTLDVGGAICFEDWIGSDGTTLAGFSSTGVDDGAKVWVHDGRKSGEAASSGSGIWGLWDASSSTLVNEYDPTTAVVA